MSFQAIEIRSIIRPMRGGSQSCLIQGEDSRFYIAKFRGNPQGNRILVNEWLAQRLFRLLNVSTPEVRFLRLNQHTGLNAGLRFEIGNCKIAVEPGIHFGSQCPTNPNTKAIFDFLPRKMLSRVINSIDFAKAFVLDKLLGNIDKRQAIFIRERPSPSGLAFRAYLIDNGHMFGGSGWQFSDVPEAGVYWDRGIYSGIDMYDVCQETIDILTEIGEVELYSAIDEIPNSWFSNQDQGVLRSLLRQRWNQLRCNQLRDVFSGSMKALDSGNRHLCSVLADSYACHEGRPEYEDGIVEGSPDAKCRILFRCERQLAASQGSEVHQEDT